jgi:hypothetical protein
MQLHQKAKRQEYQKQNKDDINACHVLRQAQLREDALIKLGNKCNWPGCTWTDTRAFQIDHIYGGGHKERKKLKAPGIHLKILKMNNPESEYQILCANHNVVKKFENKEYKGRNEGTVRAIEERLQRGNETNSRRQLVPRVDELLASERTSSELHTPFRDGSPWWSFGKAMLGGSGCTQDLCTFKSTSDSSQRSGKEYGSSRYGYSRFDNSDAGWTNQADGSNGQDN